MSLIFRVTEYFNGLGAAFALGDIETATAQVEMPMTIQVAGQTLYVHDQKQAQLMLGLYRKNLRNAGALVTRPTVHHVETAQNGDVRALMTWTHLDAMGDEVSHLDLCYFLKPQGDGWLVTLIEVTTPPNPILAQGLPLH